MELFRCHNCMKAFDKSVSAVCPNCGFDQNSPLRHDYYLAPGTVLEGQYIIGRAIGSGGFGITYVAWDDHLKRKVAIKEYYPSNIASRIPGSDEVTINNDDDVEQYEYWLRSFIDEALRLASMDSLNGIVHIFNSFVANCTAYIVMEFLDGNTLKDILNERNSPLAYDEVVEMVIPALYSLDAIHRENIIHRDIAPDNIMRLNDGKIKIFDFGSAKNSTVSAEALAILVKPGYSAPEQYDLEGQQGPYTDIYSMAAVMYHMITGKRPPDSPERAKTGERLLSPSEYGIAIPQSIENIIMYALNLEPAYRIQSAKEFADELSAALCVQREIERREREKAGKWTKKMKIGVSIAAVFVVLLIGTIFAITSSPKNETRETKAQVIELIEAGYTLEKAEKWAKDNNITLTVDTQATPDKDKDGKVIWQEFDKDYEIKDDNFNMKIIIGKYDESAGKNANKKVKMPDLKGKTAAEATEILKEAGFINPGKTGGDAVYDDTIAEGCVVSQSVEAGKSVTLGTQITYILSKGPEPTTTTEEVTEEETTTEYVEESVENNDGDSYDNGYVEPVVEQTTTTTEPYNEPVYEEPKYDNPVIDEPVTEPEPEPEPDEPVIPDEPVVDDDSGNDSWDDNYDGDTPVIDDVPVHDEPAYDEPAYDEPAYDEPAYDEPVAVEALEPEIEW